MLAPICAAPFRGTPGDWCILKARVHISICPLSFHAYSLICQYKTLPAMPNARGLIHGASHG